VLDKFSACYESALKRRKIKDEAVEKSRQREKYVGLTESVAIAMQTK
jgi:hypothetical protein